MFRMQNDFFRFTIRPGRRELFSCVFGNDKSSLVPIRTRLSVLECRPAQQEISVTPKPNNETVYVGDRFYRVGRWPITCVVRRVFVPAGQTHLHVLMEREDEVADPYTITLGGLFNRANFRPDRRHSDGVNRDGWDRRSSDGSNTESRHTA